MSPPSQPYRKHEYKRERTEISPGLFDIFRCYQLTGQIVQDWKMTNITTWLSSCLPPTKKESGGWGERKREREREERRLCWQPQDSWFKKQVWGKIWETILWDSVRKHFKNIIWLGHSLYDSTRGRRYCLEYASDKLSHQELLNYCHAAMRQGPKQLVE